MLLASEQEIQASYRGRPTAKRYVAERFSDELNRLLHDRQVEAIRRTIAEGRAARVLEIAPGPGRLTKDVQATGSLVCLEFNEGMIEEGRGVCGDAVQWIRGNGFHLPFERAFDLVYSFRFIRHFHRPDRERLYAEIRRVLQPGGWFVMDAVNERVSRPLREARPNNYPIFDQLYQEDQLREELTAAGLAPVQLRSVQKFYVWQYRSQVLLGPRCNWLNRMVIRVLEHLPRRDGLEWIVACRRE